MKQIKRNGLYVVMALLAITVIGGLLFVRFGSGFRISNSTNRSTVPVLARDADVSGRAASETGLADAGTDDLIQVCEQYWDYLSGSNSSQAKVSYSDYVNATNELRNRGNKSADWALKNLGHRSYQAREICAWLVGEYILQGAYENDLEKALEPLIVLANRPIEEDNKEVQAVAAAIQALGKSKHPKALEAIGKILHSDDPLHDSDTKWGAAEALSEITGEPFMSAEDPIKAAKEWLESR